MKSKRNGIAGNYATNQIINKKLSVKKYNMPSRFGQFVFSSRTIISTDPVKRDQGLVKCYHCNQWVENFAGVALWVRQGNPTAIRHGVCKKCCDARLIMPPNVLKKFVEKSERNLRNALEGNSDV